MDINEHIILNENAKYKKYFKLKKRIRRYRIPRIVVPAVFLLFLLTFLISYYFYTPYEKYQPYKNDEVDGVNRVLRVTYLELDRIEDGRYYHYYFVTPDEQSGELVLNRSDTKKIPKYVFKKGNQKTFSFYGTTEQYNTEITYNNMLAPLISHAFFGSPDKEKQILNFNIWMAAGAFVSFFFAFFVLVNPENLKQQINRKLRLPVTVLGNKITVSFPAMYTRSDFGNLGNVFELNEVIPLKGKNPVLRFYCGNKKVREYVLQNESNEDFAGKYFVCSFLFHCCREVFGRRIEYYFPLQIDGFIADDINQTEMDFTNGIGYRLEGYYVTDGRGADKNAQQDGQGLYQKALRYAGYTTPSTVRLVGYCQHCKRSFTFKSVNAYMVQNDVAYSEDGQDGLVITDYEIDKENWSVEQDGKVFRYYHSFCCPHCGAPYIDYNQYRNLKVFGEPLCVPLGKEYYTQDTDQ